LSSRLTSRRPYEEASESRERTPPLLTLFARVHIRMSLNLDVPTGLLLQLRMFPAVPQPSKPRLQPAMQPLHPHLQPQYLQLRHQLHLKSTSKLVTRSFTNPIGNWWRTYSLHWNVLCVWRLSVQLLYLAAETGTLYAAAVFREHSRVLPAEPP